MEQRKQEQTTPYLLIKTTEQGVVQVPAIFKNGEIEILDDKIKTVDKIKKSGKGKHKTK